MSRNRRRSSSRSKEYTELSSSFISESSRRPAKRKAAPKRSRSKQIEDEQEILHAQIGALEGFIAGSPARDQRKRIKDPSMIPPPEKLGRRTGAFSARQHPGRRCYAKQERQSRQRDQHVIVFFLLFIGACWLAWWLLETAGA